MEFKSIKELKDFLPQGGQKKISERLGLHFTYVSNILNDRKISVSLELKTKVIDMAIKVAKEHKQDLEAFEQLKKNIKI